VLVLSSSKALEMGEVTFPKTCHDNKVSCFNLVVGSIIANNKDNPFEAM
jgi:hypothetical protein